MKRRYRQSLLAGLLLLISGACLLLLGVVGGLSWLVGSDAQSPQFSKVRPWARINLPTPMTPTATPYPTPPLVQNVAPSPVPSLSPTRPPLPTVTAPRQPQPPPTSPIAETGAASVVSRLPAGSVNRTAQEGLVTRLVIPHLSVDVAVVLAEIKGQTWDVSHLGQLVGHLEGTARPGAASNLVLAGHVTLSSNVYGPFSGLTLLEAGDEVQVYAGEQLFRYRITQQQVVERDEVSVTFPSNQAEITLITCNNWDAARGQYAQRLVVKGELVE